MRQLVGSLVKFLQCVWRCVYRASYCNVLMTNEVHSSYNQFYSTVLCLLLHVSNESSRSSSGAQHNILYYTVHSVQSCCRWLCLFLRQSVHLFKRHLISNQLSVSCIRWTRQIKEFTDLWKWMYVYCNMRFRVSGASLRSWKTLLRKGCDRLDASPAPKNKSFSRSRR